MVGFQSTAAFQSHVMLSRHSVRSSRSISTAFEEWIHSGDVQNIQLAHGNLELKTGHMARFASGASTATYQGSTVLATVVGKATDVSTLGSGKALSVDFLQSASAIGRIPTNYLRRELQQNDSDILISRMIDRSLRPMFPESNSVAQIVCKPLSLSRGADLAVLGINAASCSLALSDLPYSGTVAAARVALIGKEIVLNPSFTELEGSRMNLLLSGTKNQKVVMLEMDGKEVDMETFMECLRKGFLDIEKVIEGIDAMSRNRGKPKFEVMDVLSSVDSSLINDVLEISKDRIEYILTDSSHLKVSRDKAINDFKAELTERISSQYKDLSPSILSNVYSLVVKSVLRRLSRENGIRVDGRDAEEIRPILIETDLYPRLHGSAMFQRGQSQVLGTVTFDSPQSAFRPDAIAQLLGAQQKKSFMVHYEFPLFAVNQIADSQGRFNRRSLGHGTLAEKALKHVVPSDFPYCIRVNCQVMESNGSTSMASACAGSLAMFDAGVPLNNAVAGIAIGMFSDEGEPLKVTEPREPLILTDLMGMEDYAGDMDFKIAGSKDGFTAIQLDIAVPGLSLDLVEKCLKRAKEGIAHILCKMNEVLPAPRSSFKDCVPKIEHIILQPFKRSTLFRNGAFNAKLVEAETGVQVLPDEDGKILLMAPSYEDAEKAKKLIKQLTDVSPEVDPPFGEVQSAVVVEILENGLVVKLPTFRDPVFVSLSSLSSKRIKHSSALDVEVGQRLKMQFLGRNPETGQLRLSMKSLGTSELPLKK